MSDNITVELKNNISETERLSQIVSDFSEANGLSIGDSYALNLSLEEILANVISYGYEDNSEHTITIRISLKDKQLIAEVEDDGKPFNPLEAPEPDIEIPLEDRPVGGLGIYLVRNLMDGLEYKRELGKNILIMMRNTGKEI